MNRRAAINLQGDSMGNSSISDPLRFAVWHRDNWVCRFCGSPVFFSPTLKLLDKLSPGHGYYHQHGWQGKMLDLLGNKCAAAHHVDPRSKGGPSTEANLVTACMQCTMTIGDSGKKPEPGITNHSAKMTNWDGLSTLYPRLAGILAEKENKWIEIIQRYYDLPSKA